MKLAVTSYTDEWKSYRWYLKRFVMTIETFWYMRGNWDILLCSTSLLEISVTANFTLFQVFWRNIGEGRFKSYRWCGNKFLFIRGTFWYIGGVNFMCLYCTGTNYVNWVTAAVNLKLYKLNQCIHLGFQCQIILGFQ